MKQIKGRRKLLEVMDKFMALIVVMVSWCLLISKLNRLYTLNMSSFLYVNYISIKWF